MTRQITLCTYTTRFGAVGCAVYKPTEIWQARFAPRFDGQGECVVMKQTALERLTECVLNHYPDAKISVVNCAPWE